MQSYRNARLQDQHQNQHHDQHQNQNQRNAVINACSGCHYYYYYYFCHFCRQFLFSLPCLGATAMMSVLPLWAATAFVILLQHQCPLIFALAVPNESARSTTTTRTGISNGVAAEVDALTQHPAVWSASKSARKKLKPRHLDLFSSPDLFDEFASVVCETGIMARKEVFETWAAALYIDAGFPTSRTRRIADVAAGHGLLAWALLVIDDARSPKAYRTAMCIDKRMPPSAQAIEFAMLQKWPHLEQRFDFVQGSLEQLEPHHSCLLASVHACAGLSDLLVAIAAKSGTPVALVPCCHSRKKLDGASVFAKAEYDAIIHAPKVPDLAERLDEARCAALHNAGFHVSVEMLPKKFTAKNRLIMASPPTHPKSQPLQLPPLELAAKSQSKSQSKSQHHVHRMPPLYHAKTKFLAKMAIPCEDSQESLAAVTALSGKFAADRRIDALHRKNHKEAPEYDISIWLPKQGLSEAALSTLGCTLDPEIHCSAGQLGANFRHSSGRQATTFRVRYEYTRSTTEDEGKPIAALSNERAKQVHSELYSRIADSFPGAECR